MTHRHTALMWISFFFLFSWTSAQLDLANFNTSSVKQNQPWAWMDTRINSVNMNFTVDKGIITADVEIAFTPDSASSEYQTVQSFDQPEQSFDKPERVYKKIYMDSLETSTWFQLKPNYAITELYLWVGDQKVRGELQERALASAQYESIVQRRKDPALIETWGGGSYSLRVFPMETGNTRKVEIRFVCGMENEQAGFQAILPVLNSLRYVYDPVNHGSSTHYRTIGKVSVTAQSLDGNGYILDWPGIGHMKINSAAQTLSGTDIGEIGRGTVSDPSKATQQSAWTGRNITSTNVLGANNVFGTKSILIHGDLDFEPEPAIKLFIVDVPSTDKESISRARKLALLAVKKYLKESDLYNVGLVNRDGALSWVLNENKALNSNNLTRVFEAIRDWNGSPVSNALTTLEKYATGAVAGNKTVVIYFNGQAYEQYPVPYPQKLSWPRDSAAYAQWNNDYQAWYKIQQDRANALSDMFNKANLMLFGFWNDYILSQTAQTTGGYQLGALNGYYYWYSPVITSSVDKAASPEAQYLYLPPLFGPDRPGNDGPQNLEVTASGVSISDLTVLHQEIYPYYYMRGRMMDDAVMMKKSRMIYPYYRNIDTAEVRISGKYLLGGSLNLNLTGTWGGLGFSKSLSLSLPFISGSSALASSLWAYQHSEELRIDDYSGTIKEIQNLGREYHIVNSQMSLLALEPGMKLWTEMPNGENGGTGKSRSENLSQDASSAAPQATMNLDSISLEDIFNSSSIETPQPQTNVSKSLTVITGESVSFLVSGISGAEEVTLAVTDLSGKRIAGIQGRSTSGGYEAFWTPQNREKGIYLAVVRIDGKQLVKKFVIGK